MITDRELSLAMETAQDLRREAHDKYPTTLRFDLKRRREIEEKADIIEKLAGIASKQLLQEKT